MHHTPDTPTIETLVDFLNAAGLGRTFTAADTLKNVLVKTRLPGADAWELLAVGVPGDREVDMKRLEAALAPAEVALLEEADFAAHPFLVKGYIGPGALAANGVRFLVDPRIVAGTAWVTGADKADHHVVDLVAGRDFTPDGTIEAAEVRAGDPSPDGEGVLEAARGIEIGHIFQLGRKYADAFALDALGPDGKPMRITMGSYGIGVSRLVAAIAEQSHDEQGLVWPRSVAPFDVHLVAAGQAGGDPRGRGGAGRGARRRGPAGAARRPHRLAGGEVRRRRAGRRPDDRRGRPRAGLGGDRGQGPADGGADRGRAGLRGRAPGGADRQALTARRSVGRAEPDARQHGVQRRPVRGAGSAGPPLGVAGDEQQGGPTAGRRRSASTVPPVGASRPPGRNPDRGPR